MWSHIGVQIVQTVMFDPRSRSAPRCRRATPRDGYCRIVIVRLLLLLLSLSLLLLVAVVVVVVVVVVVAVVAAVAVVVVVVVVVDMGGEHGKRGGGRHKFNSQ